VVTIPKYLVIIGLISIAAIAVGTFTLSSYDKAITPILEPQDADFTEDEIIEIDLHPKIVENLVGDLIETYDEKGIDNLRNANYIGILSGEEGIRYLYIYDPDTNQFLGKHSNNPVGEFFLFNKELEESDAVWMSYMKEKVYSEKLDSRQYDVYFKKHDGLIFASYYQVDLRGLPTN